LAKAWPDGRIKLALMAHLLAVRRELAQAFTAGEYRPLDVKGPDSNEFVAFARCHGGDAVLVIVARLFVRSSRGGRQWPRDWNATVLVDTFSALQQLVPVRRAIAGTQLAVSELLGALPVAILRARDTHRTK
jgi:(1->4)-alpha-D-glucan 1-alpha-D-glucosylmutase